MSGLQQLCKRLSSHSTLSEKERAALLCLPFRVRRLEPLATLVQAGDQPAECLLMLNGLAGRFDGASLCGAQHTSFLLPGDWVVELPTADQRSEFSVRALSAVRVAIIEVRSITKLVASYHNVALAFWRDSAADCSLLRQKVLNVCTREKAQAIAHFLCEMHLRAQAAGLCVGNTTELPITQSELASGLGMSLISFNRNLQRVRQTGAVDFKRGKLAMRDFDKLAAFAEFDSAYLVGRGGKQRAAAHPLLVPNSALETGVSRAP